MYKGIAIAKKTNQRKPENLREANAVMAVFRKTYTGLKSKSGKWTGDGMRLNTRGNGKSICSIIRGKNNTTIFQTIEIIRVIIYQMEIYHELLSKYRQNAIGEAKCVQVWR